MTVLESVIEYHEMTVRAEDCEIPNCVVHSKKESDTVADKRVYIDENELTEMVHRQVQLKSIEVIRQRDLLWCKALTSCGMDPRDMQQLLQKFNRIRPDKELKAPGEWNTRNVSEPEEKESDNGGESEGH